MFNNRWLKALFVSYLFICSGAVRPAESADLKTEQTLHIDTPVKLERANVAFNIDHLAFAGDMPIAVGRLSLLAKDLSESNAKGQIVAIFTRMPAT